MLRSMYAAISGLSVNQSKLDIIGNNIANVSTTAFKSQSANFEDMMSQTTTHATGAGNNAGGVNSQQIGLGVKMGSINTLDTEGDMQSTSRDLDTAIDGAGYFMVGNGAVPIATSPLTATTTTTGDGVEVNPITHAIQSLNGMNISYTRDGSFKLDDNGNLVTSDGLRVLGYPLTDATNTSNSIDYATGAAVINYVDATSSTLIASSSLVPLVIPDSIVTNSTPTPPTTSKVQSFSIGKDGLISAVLADGTTSALGQLAMASFSNADGLSKVGKDDYQTTANSGQPVVRSGIGATASSTTNPDNSVGYGDVLQGMLEMSNVDLAQQFTDMIVASRAFQANGKVITTADDILQTLIGLKQG